MGPRDPAAGWVFFVFFLGGVGRYRLHSESWIFPSSYCSLTSRFYFWWASYYKAGSWLLLGPPGAQKSGKNHLFRGGACGLLLTVLMDHCPLFHISYPADRMALSPISYPPDRMAPLSHRPRSGVTSNFASTVHTPQGPSHHFLIGSNWLKVTAPREPVRAGRHVRGPLTVTMTVVQSTAGLVLQVQPL